MKQLTRVGILAVIGFVTFPLIARGLEGALYHWAPASWFVNIQSYEVGAVVDGKAEVTITRRVVRELQANTYTELNCESQSQPAMKYKGETYFEKRPDHQVTFLLSLPENLHDTCSFLFAVNLIMPDGQQRLIVRKSNQFNL